MAYQINSIYGILPADINTDLWLEKAESALKGGVRTLQARDKILSINAKKGRVLSLLALASGFDGARIVVNDDVTLARETEAHGVHLGKDDAVNFMQVRIDLGEDRIVGVSCKGDATFAQYALGQGASYVSFGAVFDTNSKPDAITIGLPRLHKARQLFPDNNIVAIGGITLDRLSDIKNAGADAAAIIGDLFDGNDIESQARTLVKTWEQLPSPA